MILWLTGSLLVVRLFVLRWLLLGLLEMILSRLTLCSVCCGFLSGLGSCIDLLSLMLCSLGLSLCLFFDMFGLLFNFFNLLLFFLNLFLFFRLLLMLSFFALSLLFG